MHIDICVYVWLHTHSEIYIHIHISPRYTEQAQTYTKLPNKILKKILSTLRKCWNVSKTNVFWRVEVLSFCSTASGTQDPVHAEQALYPWSTASAPFMQTEDNTSSNTTFLTNIHMYRPHKTSFTTWEKTPLAAEGMEGNGEADSRQGALYSERIWCQEQTMSKGEKAPKF